MKRKDSNSDLLERKMGMLEKIPKGPFSHVSQKPIMKTQKPAPRKMLILQTINIDPIKPIRQNVAARKVKNLEFTPKPQVSTPMEIPVEVPASTQPPTQGIHSQPQVSTPMDIQPNIPMEIPVEVPESTRPPTLSTQEIRSQPQVGIRTPRIRSQRSAQSIVPQPTKRDSSIDSKFYNQHLRKLPVLSSQEFPSPCVLEPYEIDPEEADSILKKVCKEFKKNLNDAKEKGFKFWFIVEKPFHGCIDSTFSKAHSLVSRLPPNFRIGYLPKLLKNCEFKEAGITHIVLTITSNWLTEFDASNKDVKDEYERLFSKLTKIFQNQGIKKAIILTCPFTQERERPAESLHIIVMQALFNVNKGNKLFELIEYHRILKSKELLHGNNGFRAALKHIGERYFDG